MGQAIKFPMEHVINPGMFAAKKLPGQKVWFIAKGGAWIEGKILNYFVHITPHIAEKEEGKPIPAAVDDASYVVQFVVPDGQGGWTAKVEVFNDENLFDSFDALLQHWKDNAVFEFPEEN